MRILWTRLLLGLVTMIAPILGFYYLANRVCTDGPTICAMNDSLYNYPLGLFICIGFFVIVKSFKQKGEK